MEKILATAIVAVGLITAAACKSTSQTPELNTATEGLTPEPEVASSDMPVPEPAAEPAPVASLGASSSGLGR